MKAYTSSSSSRAMSVARVALGSSTTSPESSDDADESLGLRGSRVMQLLREQVPAERIGGGDGRFRVGVALGVGRHLVQADGDAPPLLAAPQVDMRDVLRVGLEAADRELERDASGLDLQRGGTRGCDRGVGPGDLEAEPARRRRGARTRRDRAWRG